MECVELLVTEKLRTAWEEAYATGSSEIPSPCPHVTTMSCALVKSVARMSGRFFHELIEGSSVVVEPPPRKEPHKDPSLVARLRTLQNMVDQQTYDGYVQDLLRERKAQQEKMELGSFFSQSSVAVNVIASVVAVFVFAFYASKSVFFNTASQVICALGCAILILLVETFLFIFRATRIDNRKRK